MTKQKITWVGHGSWKMVTPGGTVIYVDPWLEGNPASKMRIEDAMDANLVFVTHGHDDHIGNAIEICKRTGATLVASPELQLYTEKHSDIAYDTGGGALQPGGGTRIADCNIRCVPAQHNSEIWGEEYQKKREMMPGCGSCGFVIAPDGGKSVYFAGDTGLFLDMQLIAELYEPYVSVLPVGDKYVMGPREAAYAAKFLRSKYILPGHYNTFPAIEQDMDQFRKLLADQAKDAKLIVLKPSESFEF